MLHLRGSLLLRRSAAASAQRRRPTHQGKEPVASHSTSYSAIAASVAESNAKKGLSPYVDDTAALKEASEAHSKSPEYRELHRPALTNAAMGLFGGEPGFEKAHRVWVDPDKPHLKHVFNSTILAKNLRFTRYGYYKREMHLLDVDKLVRHARMLPPPAKLLSDFLLQKVPLDDTSCSAMFRYALERLHKLTDAQRQQDFPLLEEMFERLLTTNVPPVDVGVDTHAAMIRCCAVCKRWTEGWVQYRQRAMDLHTEALNVEEKLDDVYGSDGGVPAGSNVVAFSRLTADFFDAVLELCVACDKIDEADAVFRDFLSRGIKPLCSTLNTMQRICALRAERAVGEHQRRDAFSAAEEVWGLFDFYEVPRDVTSISSRMMVCSLSLKADMALDAMRFAEQACIPLNETCMQWALHALRYVPDMADYALDLLSQFSKRGLALDFKTVSCFLLYTAMQGEGDAALLAYQQHVLQCDINVTPEMLLLLFQSFDRCAQPTHDMLLCAVDALERMERVGSAVDLRGVIMETLLSLCSKLGSSATAFSWLKNIIARGDAITTRMLNSVLQANARAASPNGSAGLTEEVVDIMRLLRIPPSLETAESLLDAHAAHGSTAKVHEFLKQLIAQNQLDQASIAPVKRKGKGKQKTAPDGHTAASLSELGPAPMPVDCPPHRLRELRQDWKLDVREIQLRKLGQSMPLPPDLDKQRHPQVFGIVRPFGHWPGSVDV